MGEEKQENCQNQLPESSSSQQSCLREAIEVTSSLLSLSHSIRVFTVKWQLIRNKLEELNSGLIAVENCDSSESSALSSLIRAILITVNECYDLARRCMDLSYSGKLLMQSDLDVLSSKFDRHVKNLSGIYTAGVLTQAFAIVVSRPGLNACKDDMRFYIRDLLTRMKIGDTQMKKQALVNLREVVTEDGKYVKIVVVDVNEIVNILVNFLDSLEVEIQEEAAKVVYVISGFDLYKSVLIGAGVIGPLIRVLESGNELGKEAAARSLQKLTENSDNAWSVSAHGGVPALLKICYSVEFRGEVIGSACGVLRNLVAVEEIKRFMVDEGAISTFIKLARSKDEIVQINSIEFIQNIASGDESIRQMVIREGGIRALVRVLDPKSSFSSKARETTLRAIEKLCFSSPNAINILMNCGFMDELLYFLRKGEVSIQELALKVAYKLCGTSEETKKAMGDAGFMPEFVRFLDAKSFEIREMAAEALYSMVSIPKNRKRFVQDDRNIGFLLQLLDQEEANSGSTWGEACNRDKHVSSGNQALAYQTLWTEKIVRDEIACPLASSVFLIIMPVPYS
ncbi:U-box domain-containing protein [Melia azedarach]|uniref:U-box domain-containing protein n=1 Tax=Melia azedarach TaxID=155640 RepID=A0ACC1WXN6_MELAZ|nr:U-box domain-containing protein [Melia azedarach]